MENVLTYLEKYESKILTTFYVKIIKQNMLKLEKKADPKEEAARKIKIWNLTQKQKISLDGAYSKMIEELIPIERRVDSMYVSFMRSIMKLRSMPKKVLRDCRQIRREVVKLRIESELTPTYLMDDVLLEFGSGQKEGRVPNNILNAFLSAKIGIDIPYSDCMKEITSISAIFKFNSSNITPLTMVASNIKSSTYDFSLISQHPKDGYPFWLSVQMDSELFLSSAMLSIPQVRDTMKLGSLGEIASGALINVINVNKSSISQSRIPYLQSGYYNRYMTEEPHDYIPSQGSRVMDELEKINIASMRNVGHLILEGDRTHLISGGMQSKLFDRKNDKKGICSNKSKSSAKNNDEFSEENMSGMKLRCMQDQRDGRSMALSHSKQHLVNSRISDTGIIAELFKGASNLRDIDGFQRINEIQRKFDEKAESMIIKAHKATSTNYLNKIYSFVKNKARDSLGEVAGNIHGPSEILLKKLSEETLKVEETLKEINMEVLTLLLPFNFDSNDLIEEIRSFEGLDNADICHLIGFEDLRNFIGVTLLSKWEELASIQELEMIYMRSHGSEDEYLLFPPREKNRVSDIIRRREVTTLMQSTKGPEGIKLYGLVPVMNDFLKLSSFNNYMQSSELYTPSWARLMFFRTFLLNVRSYPFNNLEQAFGASYVDFDLSLGKIMGVRCLEAFYRASEAITSLCASIMELEVPSFNDIALQMFPLAGVSSFYPDNQKFKI